MKKIKYTELTTPNIQSIYEDDNNICIYHDGSNENGNIFAISTVDKKTLTYKEKFLDEKVWLLWAFL